MNREEQIRQRFDRTVIFYINLTDLKIRLIKKIVQFKIFKMPKHLFFNR